MCNEEFDTYEFYVNDVWKMIVEIIILQMTIRVPLYTRIALFSYYFTPKMTLLKKTQISRMKSMWHDLTTLVMMCNWSYYNIFHPRWMRLHRCHEPRARPPKTWQSWHYTPSAPGCERKHLTLRDPRFQGTLKPRGSTQLASQMNAIYMCVDEIAMYDRSVAQHLNQIFMVRVNQILKILNTKLITLYIY